MIIQNISNQTWKRKKTFFSLEGFWKFPLTVFVEKYLWLHVTKIREKKKKKREQTKETT